MIIEAIGAAELIGGAALLVLAVVIARTSHSRNRLLVALLTVEGLGQRGRSGAARPFARAQRQTS